ncbi:MAG: cysteine dioxygenase family protein [bacterium]|nr:cysteine dioxygenase family protein [bacterium]
MQFPGELWHNRISDLTLDVPAGGTSTNVIREMISIARKVNVNVHSEISDIWVSVGPSDDPDVILKLFLQAQKDRSETEDQEMKLAKLGYKRTIVRGDAEKEIVVIEWNPGAIGPIYDTGEADGQTLVVSGYITHETWDKRSPAIYSSQSHVPTAVFSERTHAIHRIANRSTEPAITLHVYRPPSKIKIYTEKELKKLV